MKSSSATGSPKASTNRINPIPASAPDFKKHHRRAVVAMTVVVVVLVALIVVGLVVSTVIKNRNARLQAEYQTEQSEALQSAASAFFSQTKPVPLSKSDIKSAAAIFNANPPTPLSASDQTQVQNWYAANKTAEEANYQAWVKTQ